VRQTSQNDDNKLTERDLQANIFSIDWIMVFSRNQLLFLFGLGLLWAVFSCSRVNGSSPFAPPVGSDNGANAAGDIVNLTGLELNIMPRERREIYRVPSNKWFVITDFEALISGVRNTALVESAVDVLDVKRDTAFMSKFNNTEFIPYHSSTGMAFRPGSRVVLLNQNSTSNFTDDVRYALTGYLADS
jgi:hypothetical protein